MVAPIKSIKHYVHLPRVVTATGVVNTDVLVEAVSVATVGANEQEVEEGSLVKAIYIEHWYTADQDAMGSCIMILEKVPAGQASVTAGQLAALGAYPNKKNILVTHQGLTPSQLQNPVPFFNGWYKIPKGKQRFGLGDKFVMTSMAQSGAQESCGFSTYKEYQ